MSGRVFKIEGREIGQGRPPYVVAEISGNHNGDLGRALALLDAIKEAGADAAKIQTYTADTITIDHDGPGFRIESGLWQGRTLYDLYSEAHTPWEWHEALFERGRELGLTVFSSPFDPTAVEFLETLGAPAYKIASFEIVDLPLIERVAATGRPLIISTGLADVEEISAAFEVARRGGDNDVALLHCTSGYPTPPEDANLATLNDLAQRFDAVIGLSDHTPGTTVPVAAIALGAAIIEKHVTLCRGDGGTDAAFSLEPAELSALVEACRSAWKAVGRVTYQRAPSEAGNAIFRRSLYVVSDIAQGEAITTQNVRSIRPGLGLAPKHLPDVLGARARHALARGTPLSWSDVGD